MSGENPAVQLGALGFYRGILKDPLIGEGKKVWELTAKAAADKRRLVEAYCELSARVLERLDSLRWRWRGDGWRAITLELILADENLFSMKSERAQGGEIAPDLAELAARDLELLESASSLSCEALRRAVAARAGVPETSLPDWNLPSLQREKAEPRGPWTPVYEAFLDGRPWRENVKLLSEFYGRTGTGLLGSHYAFRWQRPEGDKEGQLAPVRNRDLIRFEQLHGYEREQAMVIENTRQFLAGLPANNVLLYGDRGTGKSSTVKALLNRFGPEGLRLVEITKRDLDSLPGLLDRLAGRGPRFIIFIDDLSFGERDAQYAALKAVLEGGVGAAPDNVLIYATSNRRHFLPERFSDRPGAADDDVHAGDTLQEKLSLADRFGMTITFLSPDQKGYLAIVEKLADQRGIAMGREELRRLALEWELHQNTRSPRTARQFVDQLQGKLGLDQLD